MFELPDRRRRRRETSRGPDRNARICCQSETMPAEGVVNDAREKRHRRPFFGAVAKKRGDRGRRAFVDIGRPHVERGTETFEGETGGDEDEAEDQTDGRPSPTARMIPEKSVVPA